MGDNKVDATFYFKSGNQISAVLRKRDYDYFMENAQETSIRIFDPIGEIVFDRQSIEAVYVVVHVA